MFDRETGIWMGQEEKTGVIRLIVQSRHLRSATVRQTLRREIGQLMTTLSASKGFAQQAMMYTETAVTMVIAEGVRQLD